MLKREQQCTVHHASASLVVCCITSLNAEARCTVAPSRPPSAQTQTLLLLFHDDFLIPPKPTDRQRRPCHAPAAIMIAS